MTLMLTLVLCVMVFIGMSALGKTSVHFVESGVKVNGQYYRDVLLIREATPGAPTPRSPGPGILPPGVDVNPP